MSSLETQNDALGVPSPYICIKHCGGGRASELRMVAGARVRSGGQPCQRHPLSPQFTAHSERTLNYR